MSPDTKKIARIESIDILRGITILVMIFVNDVAGVKGVPAWMKHVSPPLSDGMTFVDVVFPAFLFIVGMSLPFAIEIRFQKGHSLGQILKHILIRTVSLLIIGVLMLNSGGSSDQGILSPPVWTLLMYTGIILTWNRIPELQGKTRTLMRFLRLAGILLLISLAVLYRGKGEPGLIELRPSWWGILGLIGWAYVVAAAVYLVFRRHLTAVMGMGVLLYFLYMADKAGLFASLYSVFPWINIGSMLGSQAAITVSGTVLGMILLPGSQVKTQTGRLLWGLTYGTGLYIAGVLLHALNGIHDMFIINKILATPPWCLISSAWTIFIWIGIYYLVDMRGWKKWAFIVRPAGENALFAYILAPVFYALFTLIAQWTGGFDLYARLGESFTIGFWRALIFAFLMTWLTAALRRLHIVLKL